MKSTRVDGLFHWNTWQPDRRIDFNSFFWARPSGGVLIDPMPARDGDLEFVRERGGVSDILVTNRDHLRAAPQWRSDTSARLLAPSEEREALGDGSACVDAWFDSSSPSGSPIDGLGDSVRAFPLRGGKSPGEVALFLPELRTLIFGDALRSHASGTFRLLPDDKIRDRQQLVSDLRALRDLNAEVYLLGDGDSFFWSGRSAFLNFLRELPVS